MTLLNDILTIAKQLMKEDKIIRHNNTPRPNADFIRNHFIIACRRAIRIALKRYEIKKRHEIPYLNAMINKAIMSVIHYPQLREYWENKIESIVKELCRD